MDVNKSLASGEWLWPAMEGQRCGSVTNICLVCMRPGFGPWHWEEKRKPTKLKADIVWTLVLSHRGTVFASIMSSRRVSPLFFLFSRVGFIHTKWGTLVHMFPLTYKIAAAVPYLTALSRTVPENSQPFPGNTGKHVLGATAFMPFNLNSARNRRWATSMPIT